MHRTLSFVALLSMACSGAEADAVITPADAEPLTIVHLRGLTEDTSSTFLIETAAYYERREIVPLASLPNVEPGAEEAETIARNTQELVLATRHGDRKGASPEACGPANGTLTSDCVVPSTKSILWSYNTNTYFDVFNAAQAVADATAWSVKPFVTPGTANLIVFQDAAPLPNNALAMTVSQVVDSGGRLSGKIIYRHTSKPLEIHFHSPTIESVLSGTAAQRQLQRQSIFCHEFGHAMGLPHNPDNEATSCMAFTFGVTGYSTRERNRLGAFSPGDWGDVTLLFLP